LGGSSDTPVDVAGLLTVMVSEVVCVSITEVVWASIINFRHEDGRQCTMRCLNTFNSFGMRWNGSLRAPRDCFAIG
jgi:hypothetical protein